MHENYQNLMDPWHVRLSDDLHDGCSHGVDIQGRPLSQDELSTVVRAHLLMTERLRAQLLGYIHAQSPSFFENLIIDVVLALGYAGRKRDLARKMGRSGDGGIDGIIDLDELGLDSVYLQAKRLKPGSTVPVAAVRDFVGSLEAHHAVKGIFVSTGQFTKSGHQITAAVSKKVVLIDGQKLADLMVRHTIGTRITESFQFKEIDAGYFQSAVKSSAVIQPRK